jgi:hypothetical protein
MIMLASNKLEHGPTRSARRDATTKKNIDVRRSANGVAHRL